MYIYKKSHNLILTVLLMTLCLVSQAHAEKWEFVLAPYGQLPWISGDASLGRIEGAEVDVSGSDILDYLSMGAMIQAEAHHESGIGFVLNYAFMNLEDSFSGPKGYTDFDGEVFQGVLEGFVSYRTQSDLGKADLYAGFRWWDLDLDMSAENQLGKVDLSQGADWTDPVVGLRIMPVISDSWSGYLQTDVGGFGVSSDSSFRISAGFLSELSDCFTLALLYQAIWVDYSEGNVGEADRFLYDTTTHGPLIGLAYQF